MFASQRREDQESHFARISQRPDKIVMQLRNPGKKEPGGELTTDSPPGLRHGIHITLGRQEGREDPYRHSNETATFIPLNSSLLIA